MTKGVRGFPIVMFLSAAFLCGGEAWGATPVGKIAGIVEGKKEVQTASSAKVFRATSKEWTPATKGLTLFESDEIKSENALFRVEYADRTGELMVQANTHLKLQPKTAAGAKGVQLNRGEVFSTVKAQFSVVGKGVNGSVEGTKFAAVVGEDRMSITVLEGVVRVGSRAGDVRVKALEKSEGKADTRPTAPVRAPESEIRRIVDWTAGLKATTQTVLVVKANYRDAALREAEFKKYSVEALLNPGNVTARRALGNIHMDFGDYAAAVEHFEAVIAQTPADVVAQHNLGLVLSQLGQHQKAAERFRETIRLEPGNAGARNSLALALLSQGSPQQALTELSRAVTLKPDFAEAYSNLGLAYLELKRPEPAIEALEKAVTLDPKSAHSYNNLGHAYITVKAYDKAVRALRRAIDLDPAFYGPYENLGVLFTQQGQPREAVAELEKAAKLVPTVASVRKNLGVAYLSLRQFPKAMGEFRQALTLDPKYAPARLNLGNAYFEQGQFQTALGEYQAAVALNPADPNNHENTGHALFRLGQYRAALGAYQKAVAAGGADSLSLARGAANAHAALKEHRQALAEYQRAIRLDGRDLASHINAAWMQYQLGEFRESAATSRRAVDLAPEHPVAWYNLALAHLRLGEHDDSMGAFEKAFAKDTQRTFVKEAIGDLAQAVKDDPSLRWGHFALGVLHMHLAQRPQDAVQAFETFIREGGSGKWTEQARTRLGQLAASQK